MTAIERMQCAIDLEKPDRVPICPLVTTASAAALTGQKNWEIVHQGFDAQQDLEISFFDEFGGWDGVNPALTPEVFTAGGFKVKKPTEESPEIQFLESEDTQYEDYEIIAEIGWMKFVTDHLIYRVSDIETPEEYNKLFAEVINGTQRAVGQYQKRGAFVIYPVLYMHPFFVLSLSRSMVKFTEDLFYRPKMVEKALARMTEEFISFGLPFCKDTGLKVMGLVEERAGAFFYPLKIFERFWWPYTRQIMDAFWAEGIKIWFHLDTCWDKNIPYFKELPRGSGIIDLDGTTDIFAAKERLRNHMCITGDVHPTLMSLGKPEEVAAYCKKLIDEIGGDGGFILCTGCGLPSAAKKENFTAMLETGRNYELSKPS
jgi:hypothetical protein